MLVVIAAVAAIAQPGLAASACPPDLYDSDILNFALNLEYLEVRPMTQMLACHGCSCRGHAQLMPLARVVLICPMHYCGMHQSIHNLLHC